MSFFWYFRCASYSFSHDALSLSLSLSLSLCFCAFVLRHGSRICLTQTIAAGFASRAHRQTLRHFGSLVIHFI